MKSTFHPSLACYNSQRALDSPPASLSLKPKGGILVWTNVVSSSLAWKQTKFGGEKWMANINATPTISCFHAFIRQKNFSIYKIQQKRMVFWCKFKAHTSSDNKLKNLSKNGRESTLDNLIMTLPLLNNFLTRDEASVSSGSGSKLPTFKVSRVFTWKFHKLFKVQVMDRYVRITAMTWQLQFLVP